MTTPLASTLGEFWPYLPSALLITWTRCPRPSSTVAFTLAPTLSSGTTLLSERAASAEQDKSRTWTCSRTRPEHWHRLREDMVSARVTSHQTVRRERGRVQVISCVCVDTYGATLAEILIVGFNHLLLICPNNNKSSHSGLFLVLKNMSTNQ